MNDISLVYDISLIETPTTRIEPEVVQSDKVASYDVPEEAKNKEAKLMMNLSYQ